MTEQIDQSYRDSFYDLNRSMLDIDLDSLEDEASDGPEQTDLTGPKLLTATDRNLATAFTELLSGKKVPSELKILNVEDGQENLKLQQDLAKAAVKVATALMMTKPGRETMLGFCGGRFHRRVNPGWRRQIFSDHRRAAK